MTVGKLHIDTATARIVLKRGLMGVAILSVAWLALGLALAVAAPSPESARYLEDAREYASKGDAPAAIIQFKNAIRVDPGNTEARYELGMLYLRGGDPSGAQRELEAARLRGFDEGKLAMPLSQSYYAQGMYEEIVKRFDPDKVSGEARAHVLSAQGRAYIAMKEPEMARPLLERAMTEFPNLPAVLGAHAILLRQDGKLAEAEAEVDRALVQEATQPELLVMKGELRQQQKDLDGAIRYFTMAIEKYPSFPLPRIARAMVNAERDNRNAVADDIAVVLAQSPDHPLALYLQAFLFARENKFKDAVQILLAQSRLQDSYPPALYLLAASALGDNQLELALTHADRYYAKLPGSVQGAALLGTIHMRMNNPAAALAVLEPVATAAPQEPTIRRHLANAYLGTGRSEDAIRLLEQDLTVNPDDAQARMALAVGAAQSGNSEQGYAQLEKILESDPSSQQANVMLVLMALQNREINRALQAADDMIAAAPDSANPHNLKGTIQLAADNLDDARTSFMAALERDATFVPAQLNLARLEDRLGNRAQARGWYEKTLVNEPRNITAQEGLAELAVRDGNIAEAVRVLEQAIAANPASTTTRTRLVSILLSNKQNDRALIAARDFAGAMPNNPQAIEALGNAQIANGDFTNGLASYQRMAALSPRNAEAQRRLGRAYAKAALDLKDAAKWDQARSALDAALAIAPDFELALADRINLEREAGNPEGAGRQLQKLLAERPESIVRLTLAGDFEANAGNQAAAVGHYQKAWALQKTPLTARKMYAALAATNKREEGAKILTDWVAANPSDFETRFMLLSHYIATQQYPLAVKEAAAMWDPLESTCRHASLSIL